MRPWVVTLVLGNYTAPQLALLGVSAFAAGVDVKAVVA